MSSQWENFLRNLGEWSGSFASFDPHGHLLDTTPSLLTLEASDDASVVRFRLRRFADGEGSPDSTPVKDSTQEIRTLGKQVVFFPTGAFSKGALQVSPITPFGAEYGFVDADRRLRLVQLFSSDGRFERLVLIREFRLHSDARERPPLALADLTGLWEGQALTITAEWPEPAVSAGSTNVTVGAGGEVTIRTDYGGLRFLESGHSEDGCLHIEGDGDAPARLNLLPDGASSTVPLQVSHRRPFHVEFGWLVTPTLRRRLIRSYNDRGEWIASTHLSESRIGPATDTGD